PSRLRLSDVRSTSNVRHVPRPMTGSFSPDEGIGRTIIVDDSVADCACDARIGTSNPAAPTPINRVASRRVISLRGLIVPFVMSSVVETSLTVKSDKGKRFLDFARNDTNF